MSTEIPDRSAVSYVVEQKHKLKLAPMDVPRHPSKVAVFSSLDFPGQTAPTWEFYAMNPAVEFEGEVLPIVVSPVVSKGIVLIFDRNINPLEEVLKP